MKSQTNVSLKTARLRLREHIFDDWTVIDVYAPEERFWRHLQIGEIKKGGARDYIEKILSDPKVDPRREYNLAIVLKETGQLIGSFRLGGIDFAKKSGSLGYGLNPVHWGQGYATEAVGRLISFGFQELGLHPIFATCDVANPASSRVMEKNAMTREGTMRDNELSKGGWRSSYLYAILEQEHL